MHLPPIQGHFLLHQQIAYLKACVLDNQLLQSNTKCSFGLLIHLNTVSYKLKYVFTIEESVLPDSLGRKRPPGSSNNELRTCKSNRWGCLNNSTCFNHFWKNLLVTYHVLLQYLILRTRFSSEQHSRKKCLIKELNTNRSDIELTNKLYKKKLCKKVPI